MIQMAFIVLDSMNDSRSMQVYQYHCDFSHFRIVFVFDMIILITHSKINNKVL